ncbi:MAG: hypothetical protein R3E39_04950 [Anaerolineae bacterium]
MTDSSGNTFNLLRRLQEQNASSLKKAIESKPASGFDIVPFSEPEADQSFVNVVVYPQDPFVSEPEVRQMSSRLIGLGLVNARFQVKDGMSATAQPDSQGNYLLWPDKPEFDQINSFYYATFTLQMFESYARHVIPWSFGTAPLFINPHFGQGGNAFYNELDHLLGFNGFVDGDSSVIQSAQSADVVSHETGHAVLDGLRDLYNESFGLGCAAFHESFGDMAAVLVALHDDSLIQKLLDWTGGDLRLDNFIASLAEQVTNRLRANGRDLSERSVYLRNALNSFVNASFDELPLSPENPEIQLARDSHNYSRVFTGAFYDILVAIYEDQRTTIADRVAIHRARDVVGHLLVTAVELGPVGELNFADMAKAFLAADKFLNNAEYTHLLIPIFDKRRILPELLAREYCTSLDNLPSIVAPTIVTSPDTATQYLNDVVRPKLAFLQGYELFPLAAYTNSAGNIFMTYVVSRRIQLNGAQYREHDGYHVDAFGGLTLAFQTDGSVGSIYWRPVSDEDVRQIQITTADLVSRGDMGKFSPQNAQLSIEPYTMLGYWVKYDRIGLLFKNPVLVDPLPGRRINFKDYLAKWHETLKKR